MKDLVTGFLKVSMVFGAFYLAGLGIGLGVSHALKLSPLTIQQNTTVRNAAEPPK